MTVAQVITALQNGAISPSSECQLVQDGTIFEIAGINAVSGSVAVVGSAPTVSGVTQIVAGGAVQ